jgi:hypothetical protein
MSIFSRKSASPSGGPSASQIQEAARRLNAGDSRLADQLAADAGPDSQAVAMQILGASIDFSEIEGA